MRCFSIRRGGRQEYTDGQLVKQTYGRQSEERPRRTRLRPTSCSEYLCCFEDCFEVKLLFVVVSGAAVSANHTQEQQPGVRKNCLIVWRVFYQFQKLSEAIA